MTDPSQPPSDHLARIYLDGFVSGAGTILATYFKSWAPEERRRIARVVARSLVHDPLAREEIAIQITQRLAGIESEPITFEVAVIDQ